jgi:hypothetical protein
VSGRSGDPDRPSSPSGDGDTELTSLIPDSRETPSPPRKTPRDTDLLVNLRNEPPSGAHEDRQTVASGGPQDDVRLVLEQLDRLTADLRRRGPSDPEATPTGSDDVPANPPSEAWYEGDPVQSGISPYLEERLKVASASMAALGRDIRELGGRWERLQSAADILEQEIANATLESGFIHTAQGMGEEPHALGGASPMTSPALLGGKDATGNLSSAAAPTAFAGFTVLRYNSTIRSLKARRRRLAWWTVAVAAAISVVLVTLSVVAREPMPSMWIAFLPVIWMIPVPFFVISFFSTQRVLRGNHLDMAGPP